MKTEQETPVPEPARGHDVFVSYSRADRERVAELTEALTERGKRAWVDLEDIPPSAEWMAEIRAAIEAADGYLVVISPDLARSQVCAEELEHARDAGKRIVPVLVRPTDPSSVPPALAALNWIDATEGTAAEPLDRIVQALETDLDFTKGHTRLLLRASEWANRDADRSLLLRGSDLKEAESFLVRAQGKEPAPTPLQARYIQVSRQASARRQRSAIAVVTVMFVIAAALGVAALQQRNAASRNARIAERRAAESRSRELAATSIGQLKVDPERSLLLALDAMESARTPEALDALRQALSDSLVRATFTGHEGGVLSVASSPDGSRVLSAGLDGTARIWAEADGAALLLEGHEDLVEMASFSPDGTLVVTASFDGTAKVWDGGTGEALLELEGHEGAVHRAAFSPDGSRIVTAGGDGLAMIWDASTGERILVLRGHTRSIYDARFAPDGTRVVTASDDDTARIWSATTGRTERVLRGHADGLYTAAFDHGGERVVTASEDGSAKVWDVATGRLVADLTGSRGPVVVATFDPEGRTVATANEDGTARLWDPSSGAQLAVLRGHTDELNTVGFSSDGRLVVTASEDGSARVWDASDGSPVATLLGHVGPVLSAAFAPDDRQVITGGADGTVRLWAATPSTTVFRGDGAWIAPGHGGPAFLMMTPDGAVHVVSDATGEELWTASADVPQMWGGFTGDGSLVVTAGPDGVGRVWDAASGELVSELQGHEPAFLAADSYGTDLALTWGDDGTARLWEPHTGDQLQVFDHGDAIWEAHISSDRTHVFTTGIADGIVEMWDADSGETLWRHTGLITTGGIGAGFSPEGDLVGTVARQAVIWDSMTGQQVATMDHPGKPLSVGFSPDGSAVLTRGEDGAARIWDPQTGEVTITLVGHSGTVNSALFSSDGREVVTAGDDGLVRVWDAATGEPVLTLTSAAGAAQYAFFSNDGSAIVSQSQGGVRIDRCEVCAPTEQLLVLAEERTTRDLTDLEHAEFLGGDDRASAPTRRAGLMSTSGEPVPDGPLAAGTYQAVDFDPPLTFTLPDGWGSSTFLDWSRFGEAPVAVVVQLQRIDEPYNGLSFIMLAPGRVIDGNKTWDERQNIVPFPPDLAAWLDAHPNLEVIRSTPVTIGGVDGPSVDEMVTSVPDDPWPNCGGGCVTPLALTLHHPTGPITTDDLINVLGPGEVDRWIVLATEEGTILINAFSPTRKGFERFMPIVDEVLRTVEIGADG